MIRAVSILGAYRVSGVRSWSRRMEAAPPPGVHWASLVVGTRGEVAPVAGDGCKVAAWAEGASPAAKAAAVAEACRRLRADVVIANDQPVAYLGAALLAARGGCTGLQTGGVRCVGWCHGDDLGYEELFERCGGLMDGWAAVSAGCAARVRRFMGEGLPCESLLPCGLDVPAEPLPMPECRLGEPTYPLRLLYAGRLDRAYKRSMDLVVLADALARRGAAFTLAIVGDGPMRGTMEAAARGHVLAGRVAFLGPVPPEWVRAEMEASHGVVLVSRSEGWPVVVMEAMALGRFAAVTRGCGGAGAAITDGVDGYVVGIGDVEGLAARLSSPRCDAATLGRLGRAAHATALRSLDLRVLGPRTARLLHAALASPLRGIEERWEAARRGLEAAGATTAKGVAEFRDLWLRAQKMTRQALPVEPLLTPGPAARRLLAAVKGARARRVLLYGAGKHTARLGAWVRRSPAIVGIIDDRAGEAGVPTAMHGVPVVSPGDAASLRASAVIVSSDEHEPEISERAARLPGSPRVIRLYEDVFEGAAASEAGAAAA